MHQHHIRNRSTAAALSLTHVPEERLKTFLQTLDHRQLSLSPAFMNSQGLCQLYGCQNVGTKHCGACQDSCYCSSECQKGDWKLHKIWCNKMPTELISVTEALRIQSKVQASITKFFDDEKTMNCELVMEKLLIFAERQNGTKVPGKPYRMRDDRLIDEFYLISIRLTLGEMYLRIPDLKRALAHTLEAHKMLGTRVIGSDSDEVPHLFKAESLLSQICLCTAENHKAQYHAEKALDIARRHNGPQKITFRFQALKRLANVRGCLLYHSEEGSNEAVMLSEEAYELASGMYGPEHPEVQEAAEALIGILMDASDFTRAEDFARINYETLISGAYPESFACANAMQRLANIWTRKRYGLTEGPEVGEEAERLAKRGYEIASKCYGHGSCKMNTFLDAMSDVSMKKCHLTVETRRNLELVLRSYLEVAGTISSVTYQSIERLGRFYILLRPFHGHAEFETGTFLVKWALLILDLIRVFNGVSDRDIILRKPAIVLKKLILEFLDRGMSSSLSGKSMVVTAELRGIMAARGPYIPSPYTLH